MLLLTVLHHCFLNDLSILFQVCDKKAIEHFLYQAQGDRPLVSRPLVSTVIIKSR